MATSPHAVTATSQPSQFRAVTPSDSTDLSDIATKGLWVVVEGAVYVQGTGDSAIVLMGTLPVGTYLPGSFKYIGGSTTATVVAMGG